MRRGGPRRLEPFERLGRPQAYYFGLGVDGVFTDFPDTGVAAVALATVPEPSTVALAAAGVGA